jgi:hypothetical protein
MAVEENRSRIDNMRVRLDIAFLSLSLLSAVGQWPDMRRLA